MKRSIILDCDPGCDDAIAILMALSPYANLNLEAITTVSGNASLDWIQLNARKIAELAGASTLPVYAGCPRPLVKKPVTAAYSHGEDGLNGISLPEPELPLQSQHAVDFLLNHLDTTQSPKTLAMTAPLTNLAVALIKKPSLKKAISEVIWMGGSMGAGNITPSSEFNAFADPHALQVILTSGIPFTMIGLDVTHQVATTPDWLAKTAGLDSTTGKKAAALLEGSAQGDIDRYGLTGRAIHDACVIAYLLKPELFTVQPAAISVDLNEGPHQGATTVSTYPQHVSQTRGHFTATAVKSKEVIDLIHQCLASY